MVLNRQRAAVFRTSTLRTAPPISGGGKNGSSVHNKKSYYCRTIVTVLVVTAIYTAFLYKSGVCVFQKNDL
jgi:hypothetical protein